MYLHQIVVCRDIKEFSVPDIDLVAYIHFCSHSSQELLILSLHLVSLLEDLLFLGRINFATHNVQMLFWGDCITPFLS